MNLMSMSKKIYHRNDARPALIGMSLSAKRLFFMCLAQLERESSKNDVLIKFDSSKSFLIQVKDYAALCEIDYSAAYRQVVEGVEELRGYVLRPSQGLLRKQDENIPVDAITPFTIATDGTWYSRGEGCVNIKFAKEMEPLISSLTGNFTGQFLLSAMQIPDGNAGKLYLILREWISLGYLTDKSITFDELKDTLGLSTIKSYEQFKLFNDLFFKRSIKKVIEKTEFTEIKIEILERRSRKAHKVKVSYRYDVNLIDKKDKIVNKLITKSDLSEKKSDHNIVDVANEESRFFDNRWYSKEEAGKHNIDWEKGLTSKEMMLKMKDRFQK